MIDLLEIWHNQRNVVTLNKNASSHVALWVARNCSPCTTCVSCEFKYPWSIARHMELRGLPKRQSQNVNESTLDWTNAPIISRAAKQFPAKPISTRILDSGTEAQGSCSDFQQFANSFVVCVFLPSVHLYLNTGALDLALITSQFAVHPFMTDFSPA